MKRVVGLGYDKVRGWTVKGTTKYVGRGQHFGVDYINLKEWAS